VTESALPQRVQCFLMSHIDSIEKLEVLLLLRARAEREWMASEVALELRITEMSASARMEALTASRLLISDGARPARCRYSPADSEDVRAIAELAAAYAERRVSVITFIFTKPQAKVQGFADAFLFKKRGASGHG